MKAKRPIELLYYPSWVERKADIISHGHATTPERAVSRAVYRCLTERQVRCVVIRVLDCSVVRILKGGDGLTVEFL